MKILITGATGMIGQEIVKHCQQSGIVVHYLTTSKDKLENSPGYKGYYWDPYNGKIDTACFDQVEVIINLVGASIAKRWTKSYKKEIIRSRVETTSFILENLKELQHSVRQIVSASAIGLYPDSIQNYYTEESEERDPGFLGEVVTKWENAVKQFQTINIDTCMLRIGLVLSTKGGAYPKIAKPVEYGVGAAFGSGKQWQSWIHIDDLSNMFMYAVKEELSGVYNAVAPNPVSNEKLTQVIADIKGKKIMLPNIPRIVMRLILGEMHQLLFSSQRVGSNKVLNTGFKFVYDHIINAVRDLELEN